MNIKTYPRGSRTKVSPHFYAYEMDCKSGCKTTLIDVDHLNKLDRDIRMYFGRPVRINSGYRCPYWNRKVGGVSGSYHVKGRATDIKVDGVSPSKVYLRAKQAGFRTVLKYPTFVHINS